MKKIQKTVFRVLTLLPALGVLMLGNPFSKADRGGGVATLFTPDANSKENGTFNYFNLSPRSAQADVPVSDGDPTPDCPAPGPGPDGC